VRHADHWGLSRSRGALPRATWRSGGALVAASSIAFVAVALWVFGRVLPTWNTADTAVAGVAHARSEIAPGLPIARRLVWVVVDGLVYDVARSTETIAPLADAGVMRLMIAAFPTFTAGGITSMFTGQAPRESGVRLNGAAEGTLGLDDVLSSVRDAGVRVRVRARDYGPFRQLARPPRDAEVSEGRLGVMLDLMDWALAPTDDRRLVEAIHFGEVDDRGHESGADSSAYREAALDAGVYLQQLAASLDPTRDVLIAVSDHGHLPKGGHGGDEPEVRRAFFLAWGASIKHGVELDPRPLRDVAATISVLAGAHTPSSNMGSPMLDILDVDAPSRARLLREPFDQLTRYDCAQSRAIDGCNRIASSASQLATGDDENAAPVLSAISRALDRERDDDAVVGRTIRAIAAVLVGFGVLVLGSRVRPRRQALAWLPVVAIAPYVALLLAMGYRPTLSTMTATRIFAGDAAFAAAVPLPLLAFVAARHRLGLREAAWLSAVGLAIVLPVLVWAGADSKNMFDPLAGILVLQLAPIALLTTAGASVILLVERMRRPARAVVVVASDQ
jgi:hypothetical protein